MQMQMQILRFSLLPSKSNACNERRDVRKYGIQQILKCSRFVIPPIFEELGNKIAARGETHHSLTATVKVQWGWITRVQY